MTQSTRDIFHNNQTEGTNNNSDVKNTTLIFSGLIAVVLGLTSSSPVEAANIKDYLPTEIVEKMEYIENLFRNHPIITAVATTVSGAILNEIRHRIGLNNLGKKISKENIQSTYTTIDRNGLVIEEESGKKIDTIFSKGSPEYRVILQAVEQATPDNYILKFVSGSDEVIISRIHSETISSLSGHAGDNSARGVLGKKSEKVPYVGAVSYEPRYNKLTGKVFDEEDSTQSTKQQIRYTALPEVQYNKIKDLLTQYAKEESRDLRDLLGDVTKNDSSYSDEIILKVLRDFFTLGENISITDMVSQGKLSRNVDRKRILLIFHILKYELTGGFVKRFNLSVPVN